jgi:hypothetical protein
MRFGKRYDSSPCHIERSRGWWASLLAIALIAAGSAWLARYRTRRTTNPNGRMSHPLPGRQFEIIIINGYGTVLTVFLARLPVVLRSRGITFRSALASAALMAAWPIALEAVLLLTLPALALTDENAIGWLFAFSLITFLAMLGGWWAWRTLALVGPAIDELISLSPRKSSFLDWFRNRTRPGPQLAFSSICTVLGVILLSQVVDPLKDVVEINAISFLMVAWTSFIGGNCVYWGITIGEMALRIYSCETLKLQWYDPASTPGLAALSGMYVYMAAALTGLAVVIETVALLIPNKEKSIVLQQLSILFPIVATVMGLFVGVQPFYWLYLLIKQKKAAALQDLALRIQAHPSDDRHGTQAHNIELHRLVSSAPSLPINTVTLVQVSAALTGSLVAYLLQTYIANR